ncbi:MAG: alkaline phosphatase family protein [Methanosarcinales archaeon]
MEKEKIKNLIIGFDGATWKIIDPLIKNGKLPSFKYLKDNGTYGPLQSTFPPLTVPAWISMFSGKSPERMKYFDWKILKRKNAKIVSSLTSSFDFKGGLLWDYLSKNGLKSLVLSIPGTYPPYQINGHIVGFDFTPLENYTYPPDLELKINKNANIEHIKIIQKEFQKGKETALKIIYEEEKTILQILKLLHKSYSYDVIIVRFGIPDHVSHVSTEDIEMDECHYKMDEILSDIMNSIDFDYLFLVSDHGIKKISDIIYINRFFEKQGLLRVKSKAKMLSQITNILHKLLGEKYSKKVLRTIFKKFLMRGQRKIIEAPHELILGNIDIENTKVFAYSSGYTNYMPIYILDKKSKKEIINKVKLMEGIDKIYDVKNENKTSAHLVPDFIVESDKAISPQIIISVSKEKRLRWKHDLMGFFLAYGPEIKKGNIIENAKIIDIAPTILHMKNVSIQDDIDGKVLFKIFNEKSDFFNRKTGYIE